MTRIIMVAAAAILALTSAAQAACIQTGDVMRPCERETNFLAGIRSINVTLHREHHRKVNNRRHKSRVSASESITHPDTAYGAPSPSIAYTAGGLVSSARAYLGKTAAEIGLRRTLWCSAFLRYVTHAGGVDDRAISWNGKPHVAGAVGTIAVMRHHVGIVSGFDGSGNPIIISGNHGHRVGESVYPRRRIVAFVSPS